MAYLPWLNYYGYTHHELSGTTARHAPHPPTHRGYTHRGYTHHGYTHHGYTHQAVVVLVVLEAGGKMITYTANAGDSRATIGRKVNPNPNPNPNPDPNPNPNPDPNPNPARRRAPRRAR